MINQIDSLMICIYCLQIRHFLDFTPDGPLCHMLSTMYQFKNEQGWRRFDLSSPSRKDANLEMCQKVEEVLEKKRFHVNPKLFLHKDLTKEDKEKVTKFHPHLIFFHSNRINLLQHTVS